jgi:hypothetical protein
VVDDARRVLGIVSEADLLLREEFPDPDQDVPLFWTKRRRLEREKAAGSTARDLMSVTVVSVSPDATVAEAARRMHRASVKRLPVTGEGGRLVGIVSRSDLLKVFNRPDHAIRCEIIGRHPPQRQLLPGAHLPRLDPVRSGERLGAGPLGPATVLAVLRRGAGLRLHDVQGGTTAEGIHLGAMAGTVDLAQRCYTGLEAREDVLWLSPSLPEGLDGLDFDVRYRGNWGHQPPPDPGPTAGPRARLLRHPGPDWRQG